MLEKSRHTTTQREAQRRREEREGETGRQNQGERDRWRVKD